MAAKRRTNEDLYRLIEQNVLPQIESLKGDVREVKGEVAEVKGEVKEIRGNLSAAGLDNGHAPDVKAFFERRAKRDAGLEWLGDLFRPVARLKVVVGVIGALSALAWGILGFQDLIASIHPSHP